MPLGDINTISGDFRKKLLSKNIIPTSDVLKYMGSNIGGDKANSQFLVDDSNAFITDIEGITDIMTTGPLYADLTLVNNKYKTNKSTNDNLYAVTPYENVQGNNSGEYTTDPNTFSNLDKESDVSNSNGYLTKNLLKNKYKSLQDQKPINIYSNDINYNSTNNSYLDGEGNLNVGGGSLSTLNTIAGVLSGNGVALDNKGNISSNFDIRTTLAGRVLGATGVINDSPIGIIGGKELLRTFTNVVALNAEKQTLGKINTDIFSLASGGGIIKENYKITEPFDTLGQKIYDITSRLTGFNYPKSKFSNGASIFSFDLDTIKAENGTSNDVTGYLDSSLTRNTILIKDTGTGQQNALFRNLDSTFKNFKNNKVGGYLPNYVGTKKGNQVLSLTGITTYDAVSQNYIGPVDMGVPVGSNRDNDSNVFTWINGTKIDGNNQRTLFAKTQELFNGDKPIIQTMINDTKKPISNPGDFRSGLFKDTNGYVMSKGNALWNPEGGKDGKGGFCRTWTSLNRYDKVNKLIRHSALNPNTKLKGVNLQNSVLDSNGFVRIAPKKGDMENGNIKNFMFSIENLAWADDLHRLGNCEIGPGDRESGLQGRIMWFPPYDIKITDSSNAKWESTEFIGRGEPVYTYINTERTGTLSFKIIVDHSSIMNTLKTLVDEQAILRMISGCQGIDEKVNLGNIPKVLLEEIKLTELSKTKTTKTANNKQETKSISIYFPNDVVDVARTLSNSLGENTNIYEQTGNGVGLYEIDDVVKNYPKPPKVLYYRDSVNSGLNKNFTEISGNSVFNTFIEDLKKNTTLTVTINGSASIQGQQESNIKLAEDRANSFKNYIVSKGIDANRIKIDNKSTGPSGTNTSVNNINASDVKQARKATATYSIDASKDGDLNKTKPKIKETTLGKTSVVDIRKYFISECSYFDFLEQTNSIAMDSITEKLKYFVPAFHSMTPEGLNSRLTFLMQCTKQGPTTGENTPDNMAFGRPPVCILRIGDFYHTKVIFDNVSFDYDPLVFDLNPEGIGVQPMIANVTMGLKFIGGSSLDGPISRLQNAVSFNFFANTELYDDRALRYVNGIVQSGTTNSIGVSNVDYKTLQNKSADINQKAENEKNNGSGGVDNNKTNESLIPYDKSDTSSSPFESTNNLFNQ